ncbi:MAG: hypothetical protein EOO77_23140 [Oxalobacteraceae bacterium]|jgi:uncharacterized protein with PQ loop repeat|uniref:hypothetical protein n=1 Tax=Sphingomonas sp. Leaf208 TaxID=1735679 RepID=UPI000AA0B78E|nr:hypothetical protein [Sphingomonas sp. Leaf208]RYF09725.1 MAG: hypothetical protein EOO77_23140 [Oxalobacteraceae bacterium]
MSKEPLFPHLRKAWPFGCLTVGLLASGIGGIVLVGNVLGTCNRSIGCPETHTLASLSWALLIASLFAAPIWLVCGILRKLVYPSGGAFMTNYLLTFVVILTVLFCFSPAVDLLFRIDR